MRIRSRHRISFLASAVAFAAVSWTAATASADPLLHAARPAANMRSTFDYETGNPQNGDPTWSQTPSVASCAMGADPSRTHSYQVSGTPPEMAWNANLVHGQANGGIQTARVGIDDNVRMGRVGALHRTFEASNKIGELVKADAEALLGINPGQKSSQTRSCPTRVRATSTPPSRAGCGPIPATAATLPGRPPPRVSRSPPPGSGRRVRLVSSRFAWRPRPGRAGCRARPMVRSA